MTVGEMRHRMSASEFHDWVDYFAWEDELKAGVAHQRRAQEIAAAMSEGRNPG